MLLICVELYYQPEVVLALPTSCLSSGCVSNGLRWFDYLLHRVVNHAYGGWLGLIEEAGDSSRGFSRYC
jgi:hypothetical protein